MNLEKESRKEFKYPVGMSPNYLHYKSAVCLQNYFSCHFSTLTKPYEKELRYEMKDVPGGKKASLEELLQNTIPKILEKRKYKIQRDRTINIRCTLGMDGSGFVKFDYTVYQLFVYNSIIGLTRFTMAKRVLVNRRTKYLVCMACLQFFSCLFTL